MSNARTYSIKGGRVGGLMGKARPKAAASPNWHPNVQGQQQSDDPTVALAKSLAGLQINPQEASLDRQTATTKSEGAALQQRATGTYANVGSAIQSILQHNQQTNQASQVNQQALTAGAQKAVGDSYASAATRQGADAAVRGPGLDGGASAQLASAAADANARVTGSGQAAEQRSAEIGQSYQGLLSSAMASAATRGAEASGQIGYQTQKSLTDIAGKRTDLEDTRGNLVAKNVEDLTQQNFNNYVTQAGLSLSKDKEADTLRTALAKLSQSSSQFGQNLDLHNRQLSQQTANQGAVLDQRTANDAASLAERTTHDRATEAADNRRIDATLHGQALTHQAALAKLADKGKLTPTQKLALEQSNGKIRAAIRSGVSLLGYYRTAKDKATNKPLNETQVRTALLGRFGNDADIVDAATELRRDGFISNVTEAKLKARHIGIPARWQHKTSGQGNNFGGNRQ